MTNRTIVLDSELEFRKFVIQNSSKLTQIIVFDDKKENAIFFYFLTSNGRVYSAKELSLKYFEKYKNYYRKIALDYGLCVFPCTSQLITAKI